MTWEQNPTDSASPVIVSIFSAAFNTLDYNILLGDLWYGLVSFNGADLSLKESREDTDEGLLLNFMTFVLYWWGRGAGLEKVSETTLVQNVAARLVSEQRDVIILLQC